MSKEIQNPKSEIRNLPTAGPIAGDGELAVKSAPPPNPQQQAAIDAKSISVVLSAGAGCGKTSVLTQRFLSHLEPGGHAVELSSLVAITFTERAAREMRDRIRGECLKRLRNAPAEEAPHWLAIVREMDSARISTIHSFCSSLLRSHAVEAGIDPKFGLLDETLGPACLQQAVKTGLHELLAAGDADAAELVFEFGLNRTQELLAILVQDRYRIDFSKWETKTARELATEWDRRWHQVVVPALLREAAESASVRKTLELLRANIPENAVMQERRLALLEQLPKLSCGADLEKLLDSIGQNARVQGGGTKRDWPSEDIYNDVKNTLADLRTLLEKLQKQLDYDPEHLIRGAEIGLCALRAAARVGTAYDEHKAQAGLLDFEDLLLGARNLLRDHADVRRRTQAGIALLMVDEFQDTDPIQDDIVRLLCGDRLLSGGLFVVGDAKQSIYRFRRAEPRVFHKLRKKIPKAGRLPLSVNYRSQPEILAFVNAVFDGALGSEYEPLTAHVPQITKPPCVEFLFSVAGGDAAESSETGAEDDGDQSAPARRRREGDWIARRITQLLGDKEPRVHFRNAATGRDELRIVQKRDIVVLFRAMSDVRYYEEALRQYGIDYYVVGGRAFFAQQEVFDVVNLCRFLDDIDDQVALVGVLRSPFFSLSDDALFALGEAPARSLYSEPPAHLAEEQRDRIRFAARVLGELREKKDRLPIAPLLNLAIDRTGYDSALLTEFLGARKLANLKKLIDMARQFDQSGLFTLADFVDRLGEAVADETHEPLAATHPESSDVIRLMSIHQAKGLEFPVVILADMDRPLNSQLPPARFDSDLGPLVSLPEKFGQKRGHPALVMHRLSEKAEDLAETQRLFYVAATRAADLLILSANLKQAGRASNPWLQLVSERFDLLTGQPRQAPATSGISILVKYSRQLPDILVHQSAPKPIELSIDKAPDRPSLNRFRELLDAAVPEPLPETLRIFPPDRLARRRFSVSEIETVDAELRSASPAGPLDRSDRTDDEAAGLTDLTVAEQLGTLVHAAFERLDFKQPQEIAALIDACATASLAQVDDKTRNVAVKCVENVIRSPLGAELAAARQIHREIDFLLTFPPLRKGGWDQPRSEIQGQTSIATDSPDAGGSAVPPLHKGGVTSQVATAPFIISGTIDCLFESADGQWKIVDYKTGIRDAKTPAAELLADYEIQLGLYGLAVEQLVHRLPDRIELVFVRQGVERVAFDPTAERLSEIINRVANAIAHGTTETVVLRRTSVSLVPNG